MPGMLYCNILCHGIMESMPTGMDAWHGNVHAWGVGLCPRPVDQLEAHEDSEDTHACYNIVFNSYMYVAITIFSAGHAMAWCGRGMSAEAREA